MKFSFHHSLPKFHISTTSLPLPPLYTHTSTPPFLSLPLPDMVQISDFTVGILVAVGNLNIILR